MCGISVVAFDGFAVGLVEVAPDQLLPDSIGLANVGAIGPVRRTVGCATFRLTRALDRHGDSDGDQNRHQVTADRDGAVLVEGARRIAVVQEPPLEEPPGAIDQRVEEIKPQSFDGSALHNFRFVSTPDSETQRPWENQGMASWKRHCLIKMAHTQTMLYTVQEDGRQMPTTWRTYRK